MPHRPAPALGVHNLQIRASGVPGGRGGVFHGGRTPILRGALLGFHDAAFLPTSAPDAGGRLRFNDGSVWDVHEWTSAEWARRTSSDLYGVEWVSTNKKADWTQFLRRGATPNVALESASLRCFGRAYAFCATRPILPGDELIL